jgi:hypothetical protein
MEIFDGLYEGIHISNPKEKRSSPLSLPLSLSPSLPLSLFPSLPLSPRPSLSFFPLSLLLTLVGGVGCNETVRLGRRLLLLLLLPLVIRR